MNPNDKTPEPHEVSEGSRADKNAALGSLLVVLSAVAFGMMPLITKIAYSHGSNAYSAAFWRSVFGSIMLFAIIKIIPGYSVRLTKTQFKKILILSVPFTLTCLLLYTSYNFIGTGLATTLHFTYPASVIILLWIFCKQKPSVKQSLCTCACIAGTVLLYKPDGHTDLTGMIIAVLSGIVYSAYIVYLGKSGLKSVPVPVLAFWMSVFAAIETASVFFPLDLVRVRFDMAGWAAQAALALIATVTALMLFQKGLFLCGEIKASLLSTFEPLTGIGIGVLAFKEHLSSLQIAGITCILLSVIVLVLKKNTAESK